MKAEKSGARERAGIVTRFPRPLTTARQATAARREWRDRGVSSQATVYRSIENATWGDQPNWQPRRKLKK